MKYTYFILIGTLTAIDFVLLLVAMQHREKKAVNSLIAVVLLIIVAHVFYGASLIIPQPELKFAVHELKFIGVAFFSASFYHLYMRFFDKPDMLNKRNMILLMIIPAISVLLAITNPAHHLFRERMYVVDNAYGSFVGVQSGPLFWPYMIYSYLVYAFVICIVSKTYFKTPKIYRLQLSIMVGAAIVTLLINFISISNLFFEDFGDATLISFTFAAIIQFYGIVLYKPTRMIKMARDLAVNEFKDPLIVFNDNNEFLDANSEACRLFDLKHGVLRKDFLHEQLGLPELDADTNENTIELADRWFAVKMKKVYDEDGAFALSVILANDITEMKRRTSELENMAHFDLLTGIANRHSYLRVLKKLGENDLPISIAHFSMSSMKAINRSRGNETGDLLIKKVANELANAREQGFCARIGGDEFVLLLKNTSQEDALAVIKEVKNNLKDVHVVSGLAVKQSVFENINIIDKLSLDNLYLNKFVELSGKMRREE